MRSFFRRGKWGFVHRFHKIALPPKEVINRETQAPVVYESSPSLHIVESARGNHQTKPPFMKTFFLETEEINPIMFVTSTDVEP